MPLVVVSLLRPWFSRTARQAFELCENEKAIAASDEESKHTLWRSIYGRAFPARPKPVLGSFNTAGTESLNQRFWRDTEEFIEERFLVDIRDSLNIECVISQDGFRADRLSDFCGAVFAFYTEKVCSFRLKKRTCRCQNPIVFTGRCLTLA